MRRTIDPSNPDAIVVSWQADDTGIVSDIPVIAARRQPVAVETSPGWLNDTASPRPSSYTLQILDNAGRDILQGRGIVDHPDDAQRFEMTGAPLSGLGRLAVRISGQTTPHAKGTVMILAPVFPDTEPKAEAA